MNAIEKLPVVRALVKLLDDQENLLAGLLFAVAGFVAQWQAIGAASRGTLMTGLVVAGVMVLAGFSPVSIAAYFANRFAPVVAQGAGMAIDEFEKLTGVDIDDRVETAAQLAIEKKLGQIKPDTELIARIDILEAQLRAALGMGPAEGQVISIPKSSAHPEPPDKPAA